MPVVSSKISQPELEAVGEYANRHGITVSNLIRMLLVREVASPKVIASNAPNEVEELVAEEREQPKKNTLFQKLVEGSRARRKNTGL